MPYQCAALLMRSLHTYTHYHSDIIFCMVAFVFGGVSKLARKVCDVVLLYAYGNKTVFRTVRPVKNFANGTVVDRFTMQIYVNSDLIKRPLPLRIRVVLEVSDSFVFHDKFILLVVSNKVFYNIIIQDEPCVIAIFLYYTFMY